MSLIVVTSAEPGAGKSGVAAAIARHFAYLGRPTRLLRLAGEGHASDDAALFGSFDFVPGSPATPVAPGDVTDPGGDAVVVVEGGPAEAAGLPGAKSVYVTRDAAARPAAGVTPVATVVTAARTNGHSGTRFTLKEDRTLAGFSVAEARAALNAEVLLPGDTFDRTCDHLVIAPIGSDAGQPYFRRFEAMAVVVRFDRTDMHLAALQADPECLILTGGRRPSDYTFDAAGAKGIPVLLSGTDTENTVIALEDIWERTRFQGERKLERMAELLEGSGLFDLLTTD